MDAVKVNGIVLHITEGGAVKAEITARNAFGGPRYWQNGHWMEQASHYIVGRDGAIVQTVRHKDAAIHAGGVNWTTIGVEHNTRSGIDNKLTGRVKLKNEEGMPESETDGDVKLMSNPGAPPAAPTAANASAAPRTTMPLPAAASPEVIQQGQKLTQPPVRK